MSQVKSIEGLAVVRCVDWHWLRTGQMRHRGSADLIKSSGMCGLQRYQEANHGELFARCNT